VLDDFALIGRASRKASMRLVGLAFVVVASLAIVACADSETADLAADAGNGDLLPVAVDEGFASDRNLDCGNADCPANDASRNTFEPDGR
jgi:hypothetical protein